MISDLIYQANLMRLGDLHREAERARLAKAARAASPERSDRSPRWPRRTWRGLRGRGQAASSRVSHRPPAEGHAN